ncbi:MAG: 4Fe-4S ferredoxin iron-sulfur binding domain protein [Bacillales bacterium]|jgi:polyferredoxin|nr:4Fe-4S ferredoxin iron-sulfur binding domain protein [Bacillales bacterium]
MNLAPKENIKINSIIKTKVAYNKLLRKISQYFIGFLMIFTAWEFYHFVQFIRSDDYAIAIANHPAVAESFLPQAAFLAFRLYLETGYIDEIHPAGLFIFLATITTAWLFRRALCSWICPIGTLSEHLGLLGRKIFKKNITVPKWLDTLLLGVKYLFITFVLFMLVLMSLEETIAFMEAPYYAMADIEMFDFFTEISWLGYSIILALIILSMLIKSFWCRYLCPYGAFLGILGFFSPMRLTKNTTTCIDCGICNKNCPNGVDIAKSRERVMSPECTGCTSCVSVCPQSGTLEFKIFGIISVKPLYYGITFLVIFFGIIFAAKMTGHWDTIITIDQYKFYDRMFGEN